MQKQSEPIQQQDELIQISNAARQDEQDQETQDFNQIKRLMRINRRSSNFCIDDPLHSITLEVKCLSQNNYPQNDYTLNGFWREIKELYFKQIEEGQLQRIKYFTQILNTPITNTNQIYFDSITFEQIDDLINKEYFFKKQENHQTNNLNYENCLKHLFIEFKFIYLSNSNQSLLKKLNHFKKEKNRIIPKKKGLLKFQILLEREHYHLNQYLNIIYQQEKSNVSEIDQVAVTLEQQLLKLQSINAQNKQNLGNLVPFIYNQITRKKKLLKQSLEKIELQRTYLKTQILKLQKLQLCESISKILSSQKRNNQYYFLVKFQEGISLNPTWFSERELKEFNRLREKDSLLKIYNTSMKSRFSRISHNFYQIDLIQKNLGTEESIPCNLNENKILLKMKEKQNLSKTVEDFLDSFEMCHHCKQLVKKYGMFKCNYQSTRTGLPNRSYGFYNPYVLQILNNTKQENIKLEQFNLKFINDMKNRYVRYTEKGTQLICNRKYCKGCIKNYYSNLEDNGLCPFCQEVCSCTRCIRNAVIYKFKSNYSELGGDIYQLNEQSIFQQQIRYSNQNIPYHIQTRENMKQSSEEEEEQEIIISERRRGRPTKIKLQQNQENRIKRKKFKLLKKLKIYNRKMSQLSSILELTQTRQKRKFALIQAKEQLFLERLKIIDPDHQLFPLARTERISFEQIHKNISLQDNNNIHN